MKRIFLIAALMLLVPSVQANPISNLIAGAKRHKGKTVCSAALASLAAIYAYNMHDWPHWVDGKCMANGSRILDYFCYNPEEYVHYQAFMRWANSRH